jgi:WD40 repeat protein
MDKSIQVQQAQQIQQAQQANITEVTTKKFRGGNGFISVSIYNHRGDIVYVGDKDSLIISAIDVRTWTILGTFHGHNGTVYDLELSEDDNTLVSCCADLSLTVYNTKNGEIIKKFENMIGKPKFVIIKGDKILVYCESLGKRYKSYLQIYEFDENEVVKFTKQIPWSNPSKITTIEWYNETFVIIGCENGNIVIKDIVNEDIPEKVYSFHTNGIMSICFNKERTNILTGSLDGKAHIINLVNVSTDLNNSTNSTNSTNLTDSNELPSIIKTFTSTGPINSAIYTNNEKKVVIAGGTAAIDVALTDNNDFKIKIYRTKDQKLVNEISDHFGTVRQLTHAPNCKNFISSGQDGYANIYLFEESSIYFEGFPINEPFGNALTAKPESLILQTKINNIDFVNANKNQQKPKVEEKNNIIGMTGNTVPNTKGLFTPSRNYYKEYMERKNENGDDNSNDNGNSYGNSTPYYYNFNEENYKKRDEDEKNTIVISGLPQDISVKTIADIFDIFGRIEGSINIVRNPYDTMAFVKYWDKKSAEKAIEQKHRTSLDNCIIHVDLAKPRRR